MIAEENLGAGRGESRRQPGSETPARTGDDCDLVFEAEEGLRTQAGELISAKCVQFPVFCHGAPHRVQGGADSVFIPYRSIAAATVDIETRSSLASACSAATRI